MSDESITTIPPGDTSPPSDEKKSAAGRKKLDKKGFAASLSQELFGQRDVKVLNLEIQLSGPGLSRFVRGFLNYSEACKLAGREADVSEFIDLSLEPGLKSRFKFQVADATAAEDCARKAFPGAFTTKKARNPKGQLVN